jgi:hypothetical protein
MTPPKIQALGVTQEWFGTRWKATGYVEGVGWLAAWGTSLIGAMAALQTLATQRVAEAAEGVKGMRRRESHRPPNVADWP